MEILGIIPARGGSKGIPGKNIKALGGKPLLEYTAEAANESKLLSRVILSSDDQNIIEAAEKIGLEVPFLRPEDVSTGRYLQPGSHSTCAELLCSKRGKI